LLRSPHRAWLLLPFCVTPFAVCTPHRTRSRLRLRVCACALPDFGSGLLPDSPLPAGSCAICSPIPLRFVGYSTVRTVCRFCVYWHTLQFCGLLRLRALVRLLFTRLRAVRAFTVPRLVRSTFVAAIRLRARSLAGTRAFTPVGYALILFTVTAHRVRFRFSCTTRTFAFPLRFPSYVALILILFGYWPVVPVTRLLFQCLARTATVTDWFCVLLRVFYVGCPVSLRFRCHCTLQLDTFCG